MNNPMPTADSARLPQHSSHRVSDPRQARPEALWIHGSQRSVKLICGAQSSGSQVGAVLDSGEHLVAMSGDISGCHRGEEGAAGIWRVEARLLLNIL